ncbi:MAG TPA: hypothetical protein VEB86_17770 [Chryseosolibacter sp.]|nr:hypothetical protein [Chryseosolibacter sp.]
MITPDLLERKEGQDIPWMKSLTSCSTKMREMGYTEDFQVDKNGLSKFGQGTKVYKPEEVRIVNFYRFEGESDPGDNTIMYVIETNDGVKGTLVDGYGAYASDDVSKFIVQVEDIQKQMPHSNA